jgi:hypothetical protein
MRLLNDDEHLKLWHLCNRIVVEVSGARAAMLCDARDGNVLITIGETEQTGTPSGVEKLGPGERVVKGEPGNVYGVDLPNDFMLAVLHDAAALESLRATVHRAQAEFAEVLKPPAAAAPPKKPAPERKKKAKKKSKKKA